jgi:anaerobic selenocysteine-containing dehydrogenase
MGATALALQQMQDVFWTAETEVEDPGWVPGIETRHRSACLVCPARCGIQGRLVDGRLVRIVGNPLHPMSQGGVCPRGVAGVQMLYHSERLSSPLVRVGPRGAGQWRPLSPEGAVALIVERLQDLRSAGRPEALALLAGYCAGTMSDLWRQFLRAYGSPNYVSDEYEDGMDAIMGLMHGIPRRPGYDLEQADLVLSFGAPLFESWWAPLQAFVAYASPNGNEAGGGRFIQIDTRFSRTASRTHDWIGIRPGTHGVLALGVAYVLLRDELFDARFVAERVSGFTDAVDERGRLREGFRSLVMRNYRTEEVSAITGVPVERITQLARTLADSQAPVVVCGPDVTLAPNGLLAGMAVHSLNVLLGRINRPGGVLFEHEPPLAPLPALELDATGRAGLERGPIGGAGPPFGAGDPPARFVEAVAAATSPEVEALFLYYANPLASTMHPDAWREALGKLSFVVSFSPFLDETAWHADLVLPDLLPYERWQDAPTPSSYPHQVWGVARPLVEPHTSGVHTGDAVLAIARGLGGTVARSLPRGSFESLLKERARGLFAARHGMTLGDEFEREHHRQMEARGWWLPEHDGFEAFWEDLVERGGWTDLFYDDTDPAGTAQTASGRIELMPAALLRALDSEGGTRRPYIDVATDAAMADDEFPLRLMPYRVSTLASGTLAFERWLVEQPGLFPEVLWAPWVDVAPATAAALGFADGTMVWVTSRRGRYRARLKVFPGTAPDNVCAPYRLPSPDGEVANPLRLLEPSSDPLTGLPSWFSTFVRLERA